MRSGELIFAWPLETLSVPSASMNTVSALARAPSRSPHDRTSAAVMGTALDLQEFPGDAARGREKCGPSYVVYCGRYSAEKGVDRLLQFAENYSVKHPDRFRFGQRRCILRPVAQLRGKAAADDITSH